MTKRLGAAAAAGGGAGGADRAGETGGARGKPCAQKAGWFVFAGWMAVAALILGLTPGAVNFAALAQMRLKAPDLAPLLGLPALVQFHVGTVALALLLGPVQFALPKGARAHRVIGWIWMAAMASTAIATLFIRDMREGQFSPIHLFSLMTLVGLPLAIWLARSGKPAAHARAMIGLYIGVVIAGVTAIAPGRLLWAMFAS